MTTDIAAAQPQDVIIFGAAGDLAQRKLWPALWNLWTAGRLGEGALIGAGVSPMDRERFVDTVRGSIERSGSTEFDPARFDEFARRLQYTSVAGGDMRGLAALRTQERSLAYFAIPADQFGPTALALKKARQTRGMSVVVEKPMGFDLDSALAIEQQLHAVFREERIFRIDHYLGKETVQNVLVTRLANRSVEALLNNVNVASVQITVAETLGVEKRGRFYEKVGATRDVLQNHALQLLALIAMDPPDSFTPDELRRRKADVLRRVKIDSTQVVRGQYVAGTVDGVKVPAYRAEQDVAPDSDVETYVAVSAEVDNWRWKGVPFSMRTMKRAPEQLTEIVVVLKQPPLDLFSNHGIEHLPANRLRFRIQPQQKVYWQVMAKEPGAGLRLHPVDMAFDYDGVFPESRSREAYEALLGEALLGDHSHFLHVDEVIASWKAVAPILENPPKLQPYRAGTWGPRAADRVVRPCAWHNGDQRIRSARGLDS
jgi:glucose-6-phosphate 1-dehydrogenase